MNLPCVIAVLVPVWGLVVIVGTFRRWPVIMNPPSGFWSGLFLIDFQSGKRRYGEKLMISLLYAIGTGIIVLGVANLRLLLRRGLC